MHTPSAPLFFHVQANLFLRKGYVVDKTHSATREIQLREVGSIVFEDVRAMRAEEPYNIGRNPGRF